MQAPRNSLTGPGQLVKIMGVPATLPPVAQIPPGVWPVWATGTGPTTSQRRGRWWEGGEGSLEASRSAAHML